jgi:TolA-binding protein
MSSKIYLTAIAVFVAIGISLSYPSLLTSPDFEKHNKTYHAALEHFNNNRPAETEKSLAEFFTAYEPNEDAFSSSYGVKGKALILSALIDLNNSLPHIACPKALEGLDRVLSTEKANSSIVGDAYFAVGMCQYLYSNYSEAEASLKASEKIRSESFGMNDTRVLEVRDALTRLYMKLGSLGQALKESQDVLKIRHHVYKKFTLETLKSYLVMGDLYDMMGYIEGGLKFKSNAWDVLEYYEISDTMLGLDTLEALALSWLHWGQPSKAIHQINRVYNLKKELLPADSPKLANTQFLYGRILQEKGDNEKARERLEKVLAFRTKYWGPEHADVGETYYYIGLSYYNQSNWEKAAENLEKTINIYEKYFKNEFPMVFKIYDFYGYAAAKAGQKEKGKAYLDKALQLAKHYYPDDHYIVCGILSHQADIARDEQDYGAAIEKDDNALQCYIKSYGDNQDIPLEAEETLAWNYYLKGDLDTAIEKLEGLIEKRNRQENPNPAKLKPIYKKLSEAFEKKADLSKSSHYQSIAAKIKE